MRKRVFTAAIALTMALSGFGCAGAHDEVAPETGEIAQAIGSEFVVYDDALPTGWHDWASWTPHNMAATSPVHGGTSSISVSFDSGWAGLDLNTSTAISTASYDTLRFFIHGGTSGAQKVRFFIRDGSGTSGTKVSISLQANQWKQIDLPFSSLGSPAAVKSLVWQEAGGTDLSTFYIDDVSFVGSSPPPPPPALSLSVNVATGRHGISADIYGVNGLKITPAIATTLRLPVRRWGGNAASRYNYQVDASNRASDYYFMNAGEYKPDPSSPVSSVDQFIAQNMSTGTRSLLTVPMLGYVAKDKVSCGFDINLYPNQQDYVGNCGNGVYVGGAPVTGNNPLESSVAVDPSFVQGWVSQLVTKFGTAAQGGVAYYNLDNEPALWSDTHRDVHPAPSSYDEVRDRGYAYAAAIKAADPSAKTLGPVAWGWEEYFYSALDKAPGGSWWNNPQDQSAHGGVAFVPWYLGQMKAYEQQNGVRILDYLDLHYYPAGGVALTSAGDANKQAQRLRSTRSLWDPTYVDESWISEPVQLIPRMRAWVSANYPGTKLAITEYNFGALDHINGALAEADVLGIFGREGVDLATLWTYDPSSMPTFDLTHPGAFALRMYRNYDDAGSGFGDTAVQSASSDQSLLSVYAAERASDGALTIMVVNKSGAAQTSALGLSGFSPGPNAAVYRYSDANLGAIVHASDQAVTASGFSATYPANSITLFVLPHA